jgi:hypothetical protein
LIESKHEIKNRNREPNEEKKELVGSIQQTTVSMINSAMYNYTFVVG